MSRLDAVVWLAQGLLDLGVLWAVARHTHPIVDRRWRRW